MKQEFSKALAIHLRIRRSNEKEAVNEIESSCESSIYEMGNEIAKLEISVDGDEPLKPGDKINGAVALTTTKPLELKHVCGMEITFEGRSWNNEPGGGSESIEHVKKSISLPMPASDGKFLQPGTHRFEFSFEIPENSNSTIVFSRFGGTNFNITAIFQGREMAVLGTSKRDLTILAPPKLQVPGTISNSNNEPSRGQTSTQAYNYSQKPHWRDLKMILQLPKRIFQPGEVIPISGKFTNDCQLPVKIKAAIVGFGGGTIPATATAKPANERNVDDAIETAEAEYPIMIQPFAVVNWSNEEFFRLPATIPTESSLFEPFRNRRRLVVTMEQMGTYWENDERKPQRLQLALPIQIEN